MYFHTMNLEELSTSQRGERDEIIDFFNRTTIFKEGRYHVKWSWEQYPAELPLNLRFATGCLNSLVKRLDH